MAAPALRPDERALVASAGVVFALASAGAAMTANAADGMFIAEIGARQSGTAVAVSNALLAIVLAVVGGLADRVERRRVLATLAFASAAIVAGLAVLSLAAPRATAIAALIGGKQLAAATELAFWIVIAERLDARRSQRVLPVLAATGGGGGALGALLVMVIAPTVGPRAVFALAATALALAALGATRLPATRRVAAVPVDPGAARRGGAWAIAGRVLGAWRDDARTVRRHPLAMQLAVVVAAAGVFGSLVYFVLNVALAARSADAGALTAYLGGVRGAGQVATLAVQLAIAPRLLSRLGTGRALLVAPVVALAAGLGLVIAPVLAMAVAMQVSAKVCDAGIETPAEKLAQTLLPTAVRGRISGFLDGPAKRTGAVIGGLCASAIAGAGWPVEVFFGVVAIAAAAWGLAAWRLARDLPALAIEHVSREYTVGGGAGDTDAAVDDRVIRALVDELAGPRPERAAEVLVRLHEADRARDLAAPLARATLSRPSPYLWRALVAVLDTPSNAHALAAELAAAARATRGRDRAVAIRAAGLAGAAATDAAERERDPAAALALDIAELRVAGDPAGVADALADAARDAGAVGSAAVDELVVEVALGLAAATAAREARGSTGGAELGGTADRAIAAASILARALSRGRGDANRPAAFAALGRVAVALRGARTAELSLLRTALRELARDAIDGGVSRVAPPESLTSLMRADATQTSDRAPETAAALRLLGELLEDAAPAGDRPPDAAVAVAAVDPDDLRRIAGALGEPDDDVRAAAETALARLGAAAAPELLATVAFGRRRARDRAAALLHDLPVTAAAIDALVEAELAALADTGAALAVLAAPGDALVARRLEERLHEIAHTVLLLVAARRRSRSIERAALAWRHARGAHERARTLAVIETALPRSLVTRLVDAVDALSPADREAALARADRTPPPRATVVKAELAGRDRLARALVLHALGAEGRSEHRETIALAARAEVAKASPVDLLRRITGAVQPSDEPADMPSRVETLIALGRVPLLGGLTTRQLADVAERARWVTVAANATIASAGDVLDALIVVDSGELALGDRAIAAPDVVDELACFAPAALAHPLRARTAARLIRLERADLEELVDDVPGLAAAVCRFLGERARR